MYVENVLVSSQCLGVSGHVFARQCLNIPRKCLVPMVPLHSFGHNDQKEVKGFQSCHAIGTSIAPHMMLTSPVSASYDTDGSVMVPFYLIVMSIPPLHLLIQDDQNEVKYDFFSHLTLLALTSASCDANGTISTTTVFILLTFSPV